MEAIYSNIADFILHFDRYLPVVMEAYGHWIYAFLFIIVFCETGLVVTPFLPGDSLLFACGALAASAEGLSLPLRYFPCGFNYRRRMQLRNRQAPGA